ncbi:MAG: tetratricopeptide repeat protein [Pseudomonadota bacterium]
MQCTEINEYLYEYLKDRLAGAIRNEVDAHLKTCPACKRELEELKIDLKLLNLARPPELSADFKDKVMRRIEQPKVIPFYRKKTYRTILQGTVAAVVVLAVAVTFIIKSTQQTQEPVVRGTEKVPAIAAACTKAVELYNKGSITKDLIAREQLFKDALICNCSDKKIQAKIYNNLADCYEIQDRLDESLDLYRKAEALDPQFATAYESMGDVYKRRGMLEEALSRYEQALRTMEAEVAKSEAQPVTLDALKKKINALKQKIGR